MLSFNASGGHSISATNVVEMLGPFLSGYISGSGEIISPSGAPGMVLFYARQDGTAQIDVVTGDPFYHPVTTFFKVKVL